jgi:hypothetical protein
MFSNYSKATVGHAKHFTQIAPKKRNRDGYLILGFENLVQERHLQWGLAILNYLDYNTSHPLSDPFELAPLSDLA